MKKAALLKRLRVLGTLCLIACLNVQLIAAELPSIMEAGSVTETSARIRVEEPLKAIEMSHRSAAGVGSVTISSLKKGEKNAGYRLRAEDDRIVETVDVNTDMNEVSGFGITMSPVEDATGKVVALTVGSGEDRVTLRVDADPNTLDKESRAVLNRITKRFHGSNGRERSERFRQILAAVQQQDRVGAIGSEWVDCVWDVIDIILAWAGVIGVCGATNVLILPCLAAIAIATTTTIMNAKNMPADCA